MSPLQELVALVPPPVKPVGAGTPALWLDVERSLGTPLPNDYKALVDVYGVGAFAGWINLYSPFAPARVYNLLYIKDAFLDLYRESMGIRPHDMPPFPTFPEAGGLLPWAGDDNGDEYCWVTDRSPEKWTVVNLDAHYTLEDHRVLGVSASELLAGWFAGRLTGDWYPEDVQPAQNRYFRPQT